ncbi:MULTISPECIES: GNAT family N-acetyltransferase [unclassified Leeuwenhoekiella]|uniref:GNAT family N-acetyltransferase n=1 Tax=unclassified Leeuwenhoekiella TaxID=2615029 RepID=UPI00048AB3C4|nr:GNAT family N-acetyltransferase [Leeuwenhoekiella sp. MAR_2009_132]
MAGLTLKGSLVYLRALEPEDLDLIFKIENDENMWELTSTITPFSRFLLKQYLKNSHRDIFEVKQLRLVICKSDTNEPLGLIDLFDYEPKHHRAGLGILIFEDNQRRKGFGAEALQLIIQYSFKRLELHQLYANILETNTGSISLFENQGFTQVGLKKDWIRIAGNFENEYLYQLIKK